MTTITLWNVIQIFFPNIVSELAFKLHLHEKFIVAKYCSRSSIARWVGDRARGIWDERSRYLKLPTGSRHSPVFSFVFMCSAGYIDLLHIRYRLPCQPIHPEVYHQFRMQRNENQIHFFHFDLKRPIQSNARPLQLDCGSFHSPYIYCTYSVAFIRHIFEFEFATCVGAIRLIVIKICIAHSPMNANRQRTRTREMFWAPPTFADGGDQE